METKGNSVETSEEVKTTEGLENAKETADTASNQSAAQSGISASADAMSNGNGDSEKGSWRSQLPSDLREDDCFKKFDSQKDLYRAYYELVHGQQGQNQKNEPAKKATEENYQPFYDSIKDCDEPVKKQAEALLDLYRKADLSPDEVKEFNAKIQEYDKQLSSLTSEKAKKTLKSDLEKLWGDKSEENTGYVDLAKEKLLSKEMIENLEKSGAMDNAYVVNLVAMYGQTVRETSPAAGREEKKTPKTAEEILFS